MLGVQRPGRGVGRRHIHFAAVHLEPDSGGRLQGAGLRDALQRSLGRDAVPRIQPRDIPRRESPTRDHTERDRQDHRDRRPGTAMTDGSRVRSR